ncbi:MAG: hypothetical protein KC613_02120 [Myxococcales bacterium]|nr:hypothetical protein [Myxococcales bacterium]MCB9523037.1 hypothetical protein [Myxococcales bacterium]
MLAALLVGLATAATGCGDDAPPVQEVLVEVPPDSGFIVYPDDGIPDPDQGVRPPVQQNYVYILLAAGDEHKTVQRGGSTELGVLLLDQNGDGIEGERITFQIVDDDGTASLSAIRTATGASGYAGLDFNAGEALGTYRVQATHPDSRTVEFTIDVVDLPSGGIEIGLDYQGPVDLARFEVYLLDDPLYCDDPYYLLPPEDVIYSGNLEGLFETAVIEPLLAGTRVSVVVRARRANTFVLAGGGCSGDVAVPDGSIRRVNVPIFPLPLNPAGAYTVRNTFDFTDAIPGTVGDVIRELVRFFGSRNQEREIASLIFDLVEGLAREAAGAIGGLVIDLVRGWVEDDLNDIINRYIDNDAPQWVRDFFTIGQDLLQVVSDLEVISKMRLSKPRRDGSFDGSQNWLGVAFYWRLPCNDDPNPPEDCGRYEFTMDEVAAALEGLNLVYGQFTGRVSNYDRGVIDSHTLDLQYGRLILFVLNQVILPYIADGANNLRDGLLNLVNCPGFANGITGGNSHLRLGGINIVSRNTIEGWCTTVFGVAGDLAESIIGRLRIDTRLTVDGEMIMVENTDDLTVDALVEGVWRGTIRAGQDQGPPFQGFFEGERDPDQ